MNTAKIRNNYHTSQLVACGSECKNLSNLWTFFAVNEGLVKVYVDTRDPQSLNSTPVKAALVTKFIVADGARSYFPIPGVFRNVLFKEWANLGVDLYEMDKGADEYGERIKGVIDGVPEIKELDIFEGIPYLNLATKLFDGIIKIPDPEVRYS